MSLRSTTGRSFERERQCMKGEGVFASYYTFTMAYLDAYYMIIAIIALRKP